MMRFDTRNKYINSSSMMMRKKRKK